MDKGEDRRLYKSNPLFNNLKQISFNKAMNLINELFKDYSTEWEYNGNTYYIKKSSEPDSTFYKNMDINSRYLFKDEKYGIQYLYYLVWFRGKIYWAIFDSYYPQAQLYKFKPINNGLRCEDFCQWTNVKNLKVIFKK